MGAKIPFSCGTRDGSTGFIPRPPVESDALDDVKPACPIDEVHEPPAVVADVVAADAVRPLRHRREERRHLAWCVRVGDVHHPESVGEPGYRDLRPSHFLARLVTAGEFGRGPGIETVDLE